MYQLFICNQECDLTDGMNIAMSFTSIDTDAPTAEHGAFSKSVELPGTARNHDIFGNSFVLSRAIANGDTEDGGVHFDPRKRNPYVLWYNGDIVSSGYVKLDGVNNINGDITYSCTLYDDKGDFFLNLMYDEEGNELNLTDLHYNLVGVSGQTIDEDSTMMIWDKDYVWLTWDALQAMNANPDDRRVQNYIVAAPTYSGYYDDFDNDKVMLLRSAMPNDSVGQQLLAQLDNDSEFSGYAPYSGWVLCEATRDLDESEVMDFRSNQQRPAVKMSLILDAISDPENNGGYTVIWDDEIKNSPYYQNSFLLLNKLDFDLDESVNGFAELAMSAQTVERYEASWYDCNVSAVSDGSTTFDVSDYQSPNATLSIKMTLDNDIAPGYDYDAFYTSYHNKFIDGEAWVYGGLVVRADVYSGDTVVSSTPNYLITTKTYNSDKEYGYKVPDWKSQIATQLNISADNIILKENTIYFDQAINKLRFGDDVTIKTELPLGGENISIKVCNAWVWVTSNSAGHTGIAYQSLASKKGWMSFPNCWGYLELIHDKENDIESGIYDNNNPFIQKTQVTKKILFGETDTPFKYLVGFTRMMGAKYRYDLGVKKIYIQARNNYYLPKGHVIDHLIDRSQDIELQPTLSEYKWYEYGFETPETYAAQLYNRRNKIEYGKKKVDTGYDFNNDSNNLFEDIPYTNGIPYKMSSLYYNVVSGCPSILVSPTVKVTEWKETIDDGKVQLDAKEKNIYGYAGAHALTNQKDWSGDKICAFDDSNGPVDDLTNCLVFFNGYAAQNQLFQITDNIPMMGTLNDNPCYLSLSGATTAVIDKDAGYEEEVAKYYLGLPQFSKYLSNPDGIYTDSLDFMKPAYTFIGNEDLYQDGICIYDRYWKGYINDLYEKNAKAVTARYFLQDKPDEAMRRFYYFDNTIWVISEITDYDESNYQPTQVKFVKVYDTKNYTEGDIEWDMWIDDLYEDLDRPRPLPPNPDSGSTSGETYEYRWVESSVSGCSGYTQCKYYKKQERIVESDDPWTDCNPPVLSFNGDGTMQPIVMAYSSVTCGYSPQPTPSGDTPYSGTTEGEVSGCTGGKVQIILTGGTEEWWCFPDGKVSDWLFDEREDILEIIIHSGITEIGEASFADCWNVTALTIGNDVAIIGEAAFSGLEKVTSITIPDSVTSIGNRAFAYYETLTSVTIGSGLTVLGDEVFDYCGELTTITISAVIAPTISNDTFKNIASGGTLFYPCDSDYSSWLSDTAYTLGYYGWVDMCQEYRWLMTTDTACSGYSLCYLYKKQQRPTGSEDPWVDCVPAVTSLTGDSQNPMQLNVKEPNSVSCGYIPPYSGSTSGSTSGCTGGKVQIILTGGTKEWWCFPYGEIPNGHFSGRTNIASAVIYSSITVMGQSAFEDCSNMTAVTFDFAFDLSFIGAKAFKGTSITTMHIPDYVTTIEYGVFPNTLTKLYLGSGLTTFNKDGIAYNLGAFDCPSQLTEIHIYAITAPAITSNAFNCVPSGGTLYYPCGSDYSSWLAILPSWNDICVEPSCSGSIVRTNVGSWRFDDGEIPCGFFAYTDTFCSAHMGIYFANRMTSAKICDGIKTIGKCSFYGMRWNESASRYDHSPLASVHIGNGVETIVEYAFEYCTNLSSLTFGEDCHALIEHDAFYGAGTSAGTLYIPSGISFAASFKHCRFGTVNIGEGRTRIPTSAFTGADIRELILPSTMQELGDLAFWACDNLKRIICSAPIAPSIEWETLDPASGGTLYYPCGSDYSSWLNMLNYWGGSWSGHCFNPTYTGDTWEYRWVTGGTTECGVGEEEYTLYAKYKKQERYMGGDWYDCKPAVYSIDGDGTMPLIVIKKNAGECGCPPSSGATEADLSGCTGGKVKYQYLDGREVWWCYPNGIVNQKPNDENYSYMVIYSGITEIQTSFSSRLIKITSYATTAPEIDYTPHGPIILEYPEGSNYNSWLFTYSNGSTTATTFDASYEFRWIRNASEVCIGLDRHYMYKRQKRLIGTSTWTDVPWPNIDAIAEGTQPFRLQYRYDSTCSGITSGNTVYCNLVNHGFSTKTFSGDTIPAYAFQFLNNIQGVKIGDGIKKISGLAFFHCHYLRSVRIPSGVTSIGNNAFDTCENLDTIYCYASTAPTLNSDVFTNMPTGGYLYVPRGASGYDAWLQQLPSGWSVRTL